MPIELKIPALGESITEVQIGQWLKAEGDAVAKDEITTSRRRLEQALGVPVKHFAYPNGELADFSPAVRSLVEAAGFRSACTTVRGYNRPSDDRLALKRIDGNQNSLWHLVRIMAERAS